MLRSRVVLAIIGVIVIGGTSAAVALLSGTNTSSLASTTTTPAATATGTGVLATRTHTPVSGTTASDAPTAATSGAAPTHAPSGQIIDLHGTITSVDTGNNQLILKDTSGTTWTVQVTANTTYEGASQTFGGLRTGMVAEISGVVNSSATFLAYHIHADT